MKSRIYIQNVNNRSGPIGPSNHKANITKDTFMSRIKSLYPILSKWSQNHPKDKFLVTLRMLHQQLEIFNRCTCLPSNFHSLFLSLMLLYLEVQRSGNNFRLAFLINHDSYNNRTLIKNAGCAESTNLNSRGRSHVNMLRSISHQYIYVSVIIIL